MSSLWEKDFTKIAEGKTPKGLLEEQCAELYELTNRKIIGRVERFEGAIRDNPDSLKELAASIALTATNIGGFSVQNILGEVSGNSAFKYEFYITSRDTPNYKYRAFFMEYGIDLYPLSLIVDEDIAEELGSAEDYIFLCESENEYLERIKRVLNSSKIYNVINALLLLNSN